ncbi:hypothetical protein [Flavobacterium sp. U410]
MKKAINIFFTFFVLYGFSQNKTITQGMFAPEPGKYIVSGWVKEIHAQQVTTYNSYFTVKVENVTSPVNINFYAKGPVIENWQRIIGIIEIPSIENASNPLLRVEMHCNNTSGGDCYFDDVRFYPFNGNMKSFVYDEDTQRLMAELDENNYATFYEYDLEGGLIRVKKETERGVFTIQETRSNNPKNTED